MEENLTQFQLLLTEAYKDYCERNNSRRVSDNQFSRWLGVNPASFNQWINGNRTPNYESAIILADKLGDGVYDALGYEKPSSVTKAADCALSLNTGTSWITRREQLSTDTLERSLRGERMMTDYDEQLKYIVVNWHRIGLRNQLWVIYQVWRASLHSRLFMRLMD